MYIRNYPLEIARQRADMLNKRLYRILETVDFPYDVHLSRENLQYEAVKSGETRPAEKLLSMGELLLFSNALRAAMLDIVRNEVELIVIDEPAMALDEDRIENMKTLMMYLRDKHSKAYIIMPTHSPVLAGVAENTIHL